MCGSCDEKFYMGTISKRNIEILEMSQVSGSIKNFERLQPRAVHFFEFQILKVQSKNLKELAGRSLLWMWISMKEQILDFGEEGESC